MITHILSFHNNNQGLAAEADQVPSIGDNGEINQAIWLRNKPLCAKDGMLPLLQGYRFYSRSSQSSGTGENHRAHWRYTSAGSGSGR